MDAEQELRPGALVAGRYRIDGLIGRGGMSAIWRATDETLDRQVAIKCVRIDEQPDIDRALTRERTLREARIAAKLHHPNIVAIFDVVERDEPWLILEYVPSRSLADVLTERSALPPAEVAAIGAQVAAALAAAHRAGVVHRDVTPDNVLIAHPSEDDDPLGPDHPVAKLSDFGISHAISTPTLTATGILPGTPAYFAPETARGEGTDARTDVYSLGATLYAATEGHPPFGTDPHNLLALLARIGHGNPPPPRRAGPLTDLLQRLLDNDPDARPTATQTHQALQAIGAASPTPRQAADTVIERLEPPPPTTPERRQRSPRRRVLLAAGIATALVATAAVLATRQPTTPDTPAAPSPTSAGPSAIATGGPIAIEDPLTADPCSLIDLPALSVHGNPRIDPWNSAFSACRVDFDRRVSLFVDFLDAAEIDSRDGAQVEQVGPLTVARYELDRTSGGGPRCVRNVRLPDGNFVAIHANSYDGSSEQDVCPVADTGTTTAVSILIEKGIGSRVRLDIERSLARIDACVLLPQTDLAAVPGLETASPNRGFGGWRCTWRPGETANMVELEFQRTHLDDSDGERTDFNGRPGRLLPRDGSCTAHIVHDDTAIGSSTARVDAVRIYVWAPRSAGDVCGYTTAIAKAVAAKLPPPG